jgi:hypothetical protein
VVNCKTNPELNVTQNPDVKLAPREAVSMVRYAVGSDDWRGAVANEQGGRALITKQHRQELLCRAYVQAIAAQAGVLCSRPDPDYGIDLSLRHVAVRGRRYRDTSLQVDLQLRSTTRASVTETGIKLDLDVETYNDLRTPGGFCPRLLVALVMPADEAEWMNQSAYELAIRHCAYWLSLHGSAQTSARSMIRITIPLTNVFSVEAVQAIMQRLQEGKTL